MAEKSLWGCQARLREVEEEQGIGYTLFLMHTVNYEVGVDVTYETVINRWEYYWLD